MNYKIGDFRKNIKEAFEKAEREESVIINKYGTLFKLVKIDVDDYFVEEPVITPKAEKSISKASDLHIVNTPEEAVKVAKEIHHSDIMSEATKERIERQTKNKYGCGCSKEDGHPLCKKHGRF